MRDRIILSLRDVHPEYHQHCKDLKRLGFDPSALMSYGFYYATTRLVDDDAVYLLRSHILHDIAACELIEPGNVTPMLHTCLDHIDLIDRHVIPFITNVCGIFDHTVRLERLDGDNLTLSVQRIGQPY